jgi:multiple sugar transport system substrate-binding protein
MSSTYPSPTAWSNYLKRRSVLKGGAALGAATMGGGLLAACGSDSGVSIGDASGSMSIGSYHSDELPKAGLQAAVDAFTNPDVSVTVNTTDHNTFQENINTVMQAQEDDVITWFAGFRNKFFADQGLVGDISDVWSGIDGLGEGFKAASTASDGNQYFVPVSFYTWGINYSKSLFAENGYTIPTNLDETMALAEQMKSDGITPFGYCNDGGWPVMGTFDILNMRLNGYDFHVDLMGGNGDWTSDEVRQVFTTWESLLPFHQEGANGRTWQEAAVDLADKKTGMFLLGTFAASGDERLLTDMDQFVFPELDSDIGASAMDAPIDGYQMVASPDNEAAAKEFLLYMSTVEAQTAILGEDTSVVYSNSGVDTASYSDLQSRAIELADAATGIAQFLDRDTIPDVAGACNSAFAEFIEDPSKADGLLADLQDKYVTIFADFNA